MKNVLLTFVIIILPLLTFNMLCGKLTMEISRYILICNIKDQKGIFDRNRTDRTGPALPLFYRSETRDHQRAGSIKFLPQAG